MSAEITFPIKIVFNQSGTFTADQFFPNLNGSNVRFLLAGVNVTSLTGSTGVSIAIQGTGPDGVANYELGRISNLNGQGIVRIVGPIPTVLQVQLALNGATSVTMSMWIIGQA